MAGLGFYGLGNWGLPELGLTEKFGGKTSSLKSAPTNSGNLTSYIANTYQPLVGNKSNGQTLSWTDTKQSTGTPSNSPGSSSGGSSSGGSSNNSAVADLSAGWDDYFSGLNDQLNGLNTSKSAQEGIINSQFNQGANTLGQQYNQGMMDLGQDKVDAQQNQAKTLQDLAANIRNAFKAGNIYLGARGASDSSAANQYSYALNKMGTQQRTDVMNNTANILSDINARETNLKGIYDTEMNNLSEQKNQQLQQVAVWFADAQNQLKQLQAQGKLSKAQDLASLSKDLLNKAVSTISQIDQYTLNKKKALDTWAMGVSENIDQLKTNMDAVSKISYSMPTAQGVNGTPMIDSSGNMMASYGGGLFSNEKDPNKLFA